jgi:hypothetical protein
MTFKWQVAAAAAAAAATAAMVVVAVAVGKEIQQLCSLYLDLNFVL